MKTIRILFFCFSFCILFLYPKLTFAGKLNDLGKLIGNRDAVVVVSPTGDILFSKNIDQKLIPASILKILTALVSIHYLGSDYQFKTEFFLDQKSNLKVKGYGDPLLVSESLLSIAKTLAVNLKNINDIVLDDSYFDQPLTIPGVTASSEPYDAPNGALCANFNTVNFLRVKKGNYISAEPQTPLLPFAIDRIKNSNMYQGRIVLTHQNKEATLYVGHLLAYFLNNEGVRCSGNIKTGTVNGSNDKLICTYVSHYTLEQLIAELLEYSNNFMANQLLITAGAIAYGPPGSLEKGIRAVNSYACDKLNIENMDLIEGSGISRDNQISANNMLKILLEFKPYAYLMRYEKKEYYKTGTLKDIRTRAGYIENENNELYPFVVLVNTPGKTTSTIMKQLMNGLAK
ncbi:MAG: D-alanyl-D-alanine carboxypeptidase [Desulfobacterales bacterium]|nr:D-alanyl-D-alanine carboxypeptidase [Desulfobacterales bacterium]